MGYLRERMEKDIDLKGFSPETKRRYLICARDFVAFNRRSPELLGEEDIRAFLTYLIEVKKVKPATHHIYVAALKFFYRTTLGRSEEVASHCLAEGSQNTARYFEWPRGGATL